MLTINGKEGWFRDASASNVFRHAGIVSHVGQPGLGDEEVTICGNDVVGIPLGVN